MTQPPPYPPPPPWAAPVNMYAILALVFGVFVFPPLGIYFGSKAKQQIAVSGERGAELATAGYVVGWVFTGLSVLLILVWCAFAASIFSTVPFGG